MAKILVVEDEPEMRLGLEKNLKFEGYEVDLVDNGEQGLEMILNNTYHLVVLDIMIPKLSGFDVCKKTREQGNKTPIIMLTAKGQEIDKVVGLELGADDYITNPFSLREFLARIKAVLRRYEEKNELNDITIIIGRLRINFQSGTAYSDNHPVSMTHKEVEILKYLLNKKNKIVSREELLSKIIEEQPDNPAIIKTVHKVGYKLII